MDVAVADKDLRLARMVIHVHRTLWYPSVGVGFVDSKLIRAYIADVPRTLPVVRRDRALNEYLVSYYLPICAREVQDGREAREYTSLRVIQSVLRLAQAISPATEQSRCVRRSGPSTAAEGGEEVVVGNRRDSRRATTMPEYPLFTECSDGCEAMGLAEYATWPFCY